MGLADLMVRAFSNCTLQNGMVAFNGNFSKDEIIAIHQQFVKDLLNRNIPHWKVVGFYHGWDDVHQHSLFRHNDIYGMSLIELGMAFDKMIPMCNGGINPEKGCFYGEDESIENNKEFNESHGRSASMRAGTKHANALKCHTSEMGSLMCDYEGPPDANPIPYLGTDTVWYTQYSYVEPAEYPQMLLPHVKICELHRDGMGVATTFMFIKRGTGKLEYSDTQKLFDESYDNIMPCRVSYDLSKFMTCVYNDGSMNGLRLLYLEEINETVLNVILQEYGREWANK